MPNMGRKLGRLLRACACLLLIASLVELCAANRIMCEAEDDQTVRCNGVEYKSEARDVPGSSQFWWHLVLCTFFVFFAGMALISILHRFPFPHV